MLTFDYIVLVVLSALMLIIAFGWVLMLVSKGQPAVVGANTLTKQIWLIALYFSVGAVMVFLIQPLVIAVTILQTFGTSENYPLAPQVWLLSMPLAGAGAALFFGLRRKQRESAG